MPFNASGLFERVYDWTTDRDNGTKILAERVDTETDGIVAGINDIVDQTQGFIGAVKGTNGTEASPAYSFTDDADSGMYRVSADTLGFSVSGTLELQVEAGYVDAVNGLKIGGTAVTSTAAELNLLDGLSSVLDSGDAFSDVDTALMTAAAIDDRILSYGYTTAAGTVDTSGTPVANDFARFTDANTIEGRSYAEVRADLGLEVGTDVLAYDSNLQAFVDAHTLPASDGTADQMLTTDGAGTVSWADASGGGLAPLSKTTISGTPSAVDFDLTPYGYQAYRFRFQNVKVSVDGSQEIWIRTSEDGGVSFDSTSGDYASGGLRLETGQTTAQTSVSTSATLIKLTDTMGNAAAERVNGYVDMFQADGDQNTVFHGRLFYYTSAGVLRMEHIIGERTSTTAVDEVRFFVGNSFDSGEIHLYGIESGDA